MYMYDTRQKNDANIRNVFPKCICGTAALQIRRLLLQIERLLPRIGQFLQKGFLRRLLGLYTQVSKMWCSFTYGSFGAVFVTAKRNSNGMVPQMHSFLLTCSMCTAVPLELPQYITILAVTIWRGKPIQKKITCLFALRKHAVTTSSTPCERN